MSGPDRRNKKKRMNRTKEKPRRRFHTVYTDKDPDVEEMIQQAYDKDGRVFTYYAVEALRQWLLSKGYRPTTLQPNRQ